MPLQIDPNLTIDEMLRRQAEQRGGAVVEEGDYYLKIADVKDGKSKKGKDMVTITFDILDEQSGASIATVKEFIVVETIDKIGKIVEAAKLRGEVETAGEQASDILKWVQQSGAYIPAHMTNEERDGRRYNNVKYYISDTDEEEYL